jgi:hypothetical protein
LEESTDLLLDFFDGKPDLTNPMLRLPEPPLRGSVEPNLEETANWLFLVGLKGVEKGSMLNFLLESDLFLECF